jgi:O-antigen ligase
MLTLLSACFMMGGGSRADITSLVILQPLTALAAMAFVLVPGQLDWKPVRVPMLLLAALAGIMVAQLVPLPPALWTALPGHGRFAESAAVAGLAQPWRPISLTPDHTLASLVGLVVPFAVLVGFASLEVNGRRALLPAIIVGVAVSALFGLAQVSGGPQGPFYLYRITNSEAAVGLFANRNHQAVLLAMSWPMLAVWATSARQDHRHRVIKHWVAGGFALFLLPLLLVTGSRAGLVLGLIGLVCGGLILRGRSTGVRPQKSKRFERLILPAAGVSALILIVLTVILSRAEALQRILRLDASKDTRVEATPVLMDMVKDFFPVGSGMGGFDPIFRSYEPSAMLSPQYLNHAHNDLLELAITAGLPGIMIAVLFLCWFAVRTISSWRSDPSNPDGARARAASTMILLVLLSSLVDYPLRTPLMMAIFAIACGWLGTAVGHENNERRG